MLVFKVLSTLGPIDYFSISVRARVGLLFYIGFCGQFLHNTAGLFFSQHPRLDPCVCICVSACVHVTKVIN